MGPLRADTGSEAIPDIRWLVGEPEGDRPIFIYCPFHEDTDPSYAVYADGTWCFGCHRRESPWEFAKRLKSNLATLPRVTSTTTEKDATEEERRAWGILCRVWHRTLVEGPRRERIQWFYERGLWEDTIRKYLLGHTGDRFSLPIMEGRKVVGYQLRLDPRYCDPDEPRYINPRKMKVLIHRPNPEGSTTVVCEGPLDAFLLAQYGFDPITTTGGARSLVSAVKGVVPRGKRLVIATDQDDAGEEAARELLNWFPNAVRATWEQGKDIGEAVTLLPSIRRGSFLKGILG